MDTEKPVGNRTNFMEIGSEILEQVDQQLAREDRF